MTRDDPSLKLRSHGPVYVCGWAVSVTVLNQGWKFNCSWIAGRRGVGVRLRHDAAERCQPSPSG